MTRRVNCVVLNHDAEGLDAPPYPGELGQRIYEQVSKEGWLAWLNRLAMIINENQLNTADPRSIKVIERHMEGFFFKANNQGVAPAGFNPKKHTH